MVDIAHSAYAAYNASGANQRSATAEAAKAASSATADNEQTDTGTAGSRTIHDTVSLSNGSKIVNLERGLNLAQEVRAEKDPEKLADLLKAGFEDIKRVGRLFTETFKTLRGLFGF